MSQVAKSNVKGWISNPSFEQDAISYSEKEKGVDEQKKNLEEKEDKCNKIRLNESMIKQVLSVFSNKK